MSTIRSIIFDIGNVILPFDFGLALRRLGFSTGLSGSGQAGLSPELLEIVLAYETGRMERSAFLKQAMAAANYAGTEADFVAAWTEIFDENPAVNRLVENLHGRYPLYLLSNTSDLHVEYFTSAYPVFQLFSDAIYSYNAGCLKPGKEIFEIATRQLGVTPSETVFIDDIAVNVDAAKDFGFHAIQYDYKAHNCLLDQLRGLGVEGIVE